MQSVGIWALTRAGRVVVATAGLMGLLALQPEPVRPVERTPGRVAPAVTRSLVISEQARRYLVLQYRSFPTEFMGCMIGEVRGGGRTVIVHRIAPADVDPPQSTSTHVLPKQTCEDAGWTGTVGMIHSHPSGERCWYYFPGTQVPSSDAQSFVRQPYSVDAIMCGDRVVWISRNMVQQQVRLTDEHKQAAAREQRGNRVHAGSASRTGVDE